MCKITFYEKFSENASSFSEFELVELAGGIVDHYKKSANFLDNLSKLYGFKYLLFWQPIIYTEKNITEEEQTIDRRSKDKIAKKLYQDINHMLERENIKNFYNISDVLRERNETFYIDFAHLSEQGNRVVTNKIFSLFKKEFLANE